MTARTSTRTRAGRALVASALVATMVGAPMAAMAAEGDAPKAPRPVPRTNEYAVGQSVQIRMNAAGEQNSPLADFRWSVTQVTVQGATDETVKVPVPEDGQMLHSLQSFGNIPQEDGVAIYDVAVADGVGNARSVSLVPQDMELPVGLTTKFTLDGQEISPQDLVGRSGVVTATYTVKNLSTQKVEVPIKSVTGETVTTSVDAQVPMVVEASTLLPMRYSGLNTGSGIGGADGRGNNQVKWIGLPFTPLSKTGETTFGWAANVTDAVIPSMLIQVLPVYMEAEDDTADTPEEKKAKAEKAALNLKGLFPGVTPPNISDGAAAAKAGVQELLDGLSGFKADAEAKGDPLVTLETGLNNFFQQFGADLEAVAAAVDAENPESVAATLQGLQDTKITNAATAVDNLSKQLPAVGEAISAVGATTLTDLATKLATLDTILAKAGNTLPGIAQHWPQITQALQTADGVLPGAISALSGGGLPIDCSATNPTATPAAGKIGVGALNKALASRAGGTNYRGHQNRQNPAPGNPAEGDYYTFPGLTAGAAVYKVAEGATNPSWVTTGLPGTTGVCNTGIGVANGVIANNATAQALTTKLEALRPIIAQLAAVEELSPENADQVVALLNQITPIVAGLEGPVGTAADALPGLATAVDKAGTTIEGVDLSPLVGALNNLVPGLVTYMDSLSTRLKTIGVGLESSNVDLPALDAVIGQIVAGVLASPNGVQVTSGLDTVGGGVGQIKAELGRFAGDLVVSLKAGGQEIVKDVKTIKEVAGKKVTEVTKVATAAGEKVDATKASLAGLVTVASESPLPYGGDPANAPEGTVLAGAYEFRLDAADSNVPQTPWRIVLGILIALGAGLLGVSLAKRSKAG